MVTTLVFPPSIPALGRETVLYVPTVANPQAVTVAETQAAGAVLLPQQAVSRTPQGDSVMVVASDGKVSPRPVQLGSAQGNDWVVLGGLKPGEQVIVDGFQKLRPGAPVKAVPWQAAPAGAASAPAAPASAPASAKKS